jgi:hypothetical protein
MGKLFGKAPSDYFEFDNSYLSLAVDLACSAAHWEDENYRNTEAQKTAQGEASSIDGVLEEYKRELDGGRQ